MKWLLNKLISLIDILVFIFIFFIFYIIFPVLIAIGITKITRINSLNIHIIIKIMILQFIAINIQKAFFNIYKRFNFLKRYNRFIEI